MKKSVTALLIVDAQQGLLEGEQAVPDSAVVLEHLVALLSAARSAGAFVVHLQNDGAPGSLDEPGTPGWFIHPKLSPAQGEGVSRIAVAGLLSEMCVSATIRGALARSLEVVLIRDAHATYHLEDISASVVSRVVEHALGDEVELTDTASIAFGCLCV